MLRTSVRAAGRAAVVLGLAVALAECVMSQSPTTQPVDSRWGDLPDTDTVFEPRHFATRDEWEAHRVHLREQILWAAGLWPMPAKTPLHARVFGRIDRDGYTVEKVALESYPGFFVTGNLYRPHDGAERHPGVACPHGHWPKGRLNDDDTGSVPGRCITLARMGCVVFSYDMVGFNDSERQIPHRFGDDRMALWGISPLGLQLWNGIRVLDFLASLPDVDGDRLACTGASGGGTQTFLLSAVDDRVKVAAPVNMISNHMQGGCVCENAPCLRIDTNNIEIGAMMAPRPLLLVSATGDWTKNTPKIEYPAIREVYRLYGAADRVRNVHIDSPHNYNRASREAMYRWFARWLLHRDDADTFTEPPFTKEPDADLLVFADGTLPEGALTLDTLVAQRIDAARQQIKAARPSDADGVRRLDDVYGEAFRLATGAPRPDSASTRFMWTPTGAGAERDGVRAARGLIVTSRAGVRIPTTRFERTGEAGVAGLVRTIIVHERGTAGLLDADGGPGPLLRRLATERGAVLSVDVFGVGEARAPAETKRGETKFFSTFNRTDTAERVWDIVAAMKVTGGKADLVGVGKGGAWCVLAGAVTCRGPGAGAASRPGERTTADAEPRVVVDAGAFDTSAEDVYQKELFVPGILRAGGLPMAAALIAPRSLLLHNAGDTFDVSPAEAAYRACPGARLVVRKQPADDAEIAAFLAR